MSDLVLAIDPGPERSAWLTFATDRARPTMHGMLPNDELLERLRLTGRGWFGYPDVVVIEHIEPRYGLRMGWETLDTARFIGRLQEAAQPVRVVLLKRSDILRHLGVVTSPKKGEKRVSADSGMRQALTDRFGGPTAIGRKAEPGPLYGISKDVWSALAIAVTHVDQEGTAA
jgi:hypothetical protein